jgi:hypothetical protein
MNIQKIAKDILAQAVDADNPPLRPGDEVEIEYEKLPVSVHNLVTKIRLRTSHFKKYTKKTDRGVATYSLYLKPIELKFAKQYIKFMYSDRAFTNIVYKTTKELVFEFQFTERE